MAPDSEQGNGARQQPKICIVGAGMAGLTCALVLAQEGFTDIHVYEAASGLGFVGAGIQLAPNMARVLARLGVWADIEKEAVALSDAVIRDGASDGELTRIHLHHVKEQYGFHHMVGHRASLANGLYRGCLKHKSIRFSFDTAIANPRNCLSKPTFTAIPRIGREPYDVETDILLACDGIKSACRVKMLQELAIDAKVIDTQQASYRIMLTREQMQSDPELLELINRNQATRWISEKRLIMAYPVANKQIYNLSTVQPDVNFAAAPSTTYTTKGSKAEMLKVFGNFCPKVQKMLHMVPDVEVCEWKLRVHEPLPTWVHGAMALVGDACHPTLPHMAQGAAQAIEDSAVLGVVLAKLDDFGPKNVNKALRIYETIRRDRAETLVKMAAATGKTLELGEGKAKAERDQAFIAAKNGQGPMPDKWVDADVQKMVYGTDCTRIAEEQFSQLYEAFSRE